MTDSKAKVLFMHLLLYTCSVLLFLEEQALYINYICKAIVYAALRIIRIRDVLL